MKMYISLLAILFNLNAFAGGNGGGDVDDIFGGGEDEFEFERFDDESVLVQIDNDAKVACDKKGLCTLSSVVSKDKSFTVNFNVGEGGNSIGGFGGSGGTFIDLGGNNDNNGEYWGVNVRFHVGKCTQEVRVPRSVYYSINRYMYGLMNSDGSTRRGFTPADEAMIIFYTTIMKQASGCKS